MTLGEKIALAKSLLIDAAWFVGVLLLIVSVILGVSYMQGNDSVVKSLCCSSIGLCLIMLSNWLHCRVKP